MLALLFTLFAASSTDVLANYFHVSLNLVLWAFRVLTFVLLRRDARNAHLARGAHPPRLGPTILLHSWESRLAHSHATR